MNPALKSVPRGDAPTRVLRFLWASRSEWSGREIARKVGLSAPSCHEALKELDARGMVLLRRVSNVHLYKLNPESYFVQSMYTPFFEAEAAMPGKIEAAVKKELAVSEGGVLSLVIFGSRARGAGRPGSDLDLLVVLSRREKASGMEERLERLREQLSRRFNLPLFPYVQTLLELKVKQRRKLPLIGRILAEGRAIYGKDVKELLS